MKKRNNRHGSGTRIAELRRHEIKQHVAMLHGGLYPVRVLLYVTEAVLHDQFESGIATNEVAGAT